MPRINILSPQLADMIAAGEVVERPASAVKELMENSIDAGAKNITVEIRAGGAEYIRVTDDGCGMAAEDAGVAFLRHATSKLRDEKGLEAIGTLGFRGEALAAIGAVSHVELTTRERGAAAGTRLTLSGGDIEDMHECGCPEGTTVIVRGLFYNTPARLKFMKSDRAEGSACCAAALRVALGRPGVSVRCIHDGSEEFFTPGDSRAESAVYALLGRDAAASFLPGEISDGGIGVGGFVSTPGAGRGSRSMQYFFVNGRYIKSALLQSAVEQAYRNTLLTGRFPACCIYLTLSPGSVDVNVHPAKTEVKFSDEKRVFDAVHYAALGALEEKRPPAAAPALQKTDFRAPERSSPAPAAPSGAGARAAWAPLSGAGARSPAAPVREAPVCYQTRIDAPRQPEREAPVYYQSRIDAPAHIPAAPGTAPSSVSMPVSESAPAPEAEEEPLRLIGEALGLYILVEKGGALIVIDKHAAHERMIFDRLISRGGEVMSQSLLAPVPVSVNGADAEIISKNAELLASLGFALEPYGERDYILRAVPEGVESGDAAAALEESLAALRAGQRVGKADVRSELLKTVACKAAIKAGKSSDPRELLSLARAVCAGEVRYCPHGRPVSWTLTRQELDKQFKRIV